MRKLLSGIFILMHLSACQPIDATTTGSAIPTQRAAFSLEPAPVMETPMPTEMVSSTPTVEPTTANADVIFIRAVQTADGSWTFHVTVSHPDTGWEDYADGWDVLLPDGSKLMVNDSDPFTRLLAHPHVNEQPFTRSQNGIIIPENVTEVTVRAHDLLDGFGGQEVVVDLTASAG